MHLQNGIENALERGVLKKTTKNYARKAISILKHLSRTRERGFYYRVKMCAEIDAKWLILLSWRK